jgi:hypothetical protein
MLPKKRGASSMEAALNGCKLFVHIQGAVLQNDIVNHMVSLPAVHRDCKET